MTLTYQYPVVYFYGDDEEDLEIIQKEGWIEPLKTDKVVLEFPGGIWAVNWLI